MRNKKLLLALTLPAVFAACNNEEILTEAPVNNTEIVGANLVSEGLVINVKNGVESRLTTGGWEMTDELGLGWLNAKSSIYDDQKGGTAVADTRVYANHLFKKNENGAFSTYGNVYEGYHFAYYAYQYMPQAGQMIVTVNPEQKEAWSAEHLNSTFHISAQDFITVDKVDVNTRELTDVSFEVVPAVNELAIKIVPDAQFTDDEVLSSLNIKNIALTANTGKTPFYSTIKLQPRYLPANQYDKNEYDSEKTLKKMTAANLYLNGTTVTSHAKAPIVRDGASKTLTTTVTDEACDLSGNQFVRMFNTPVSVLKSSTDLTDKADASKYTIKVTVSAGYFNVKYTKNAEEGSYAASNNAALEEIAGLLSKEGYGDDEINFSELIETQGITLYLDASMFKADYSKITSKEDWKDCVALADALGEEGPVTFNVINEVKFEDGEIPMPNCAVEVSSSSKGALIIENDVTWPATLTKKAGKNLVIKVKGTGTLNVNSVVDATTFENEGVINAGPLSSISTAATATLVNKSRVVVEYGAYVYPSVHGIIAYNVDGTESASKINTLVATSGSQHGYAKVNTLIVENGVSLNLTKKDNNNTDDDRYHGSTVYGDNLVDMSNVTIEMNGGSIKAALNNVKDVYDVVIKGGENFVTDINMKGDLVVEAGNITIDATEYAVTKVVGGNTVVEMVKDAVFAGNIVNEGEIISNVDVYVSNINNADGTIKVTKPYTMWYFGSYVQGGTAQGNILKALSTVWDGTAIKEPAMDGGVYQVNEAAELAWFAGKEWGGVGATEYSLKIKLNADLNMGGYEFKGISIKNDNFSGTSTVEFDGNNKTIKGLNVIPGANLSGTGTTTGLFRNVSASLTIKDLTIAKSESNGEKWCGMLVGYNYGVQLSISNVNVEDCTVNGKKRIGGFIGNNTDGGTVSITNSSVKGCKITASESHGGIFIGTYTTAVTLNTSGNISIDNTLTVNNVSSTSLYTQN